jgi:EAL domain-containing protein (putative c-di-GMP-specific phosphodiesterase class I)
LRRGVEQGQFVLHYQPQLDLRTGMLSGVEALVRWQHPQRGMIPPMEFIPVAEETGLIVRLGSWVLAEACRQLAEWRSAGIVHIHMSVNLSALQFADPELPARIAAVLQENGLPPQMLDLEITESMAMASPQETERIMRLIAQQGPSFSIDDFGTGYSSLAYLKQFPIRTLKIDRAFVKDIDTEGNDADICEVSVLLAHKLGLDVVAEGVETGGADEFSQGNRLREDPGLFHQQAAAGSGCHGLHQGLRGLTHRCEETFWPILRILGYRSASMAPEISAALAFSAVL